MRFLNIVLSVFLMVMRVPIKYSWPKKIRLKRPLDVLVLLFYLTGLLCVAARLLVCCALDRIWSSTQRLEDLDWFGPNVPYVQYGGGVFALLLSSPVLKVQRGAYKLVKQCRISRTPTFSYVGGFPFYSPRWGPHLHVSSIVPWHRWVSFIFVSRRGPLGRSGVGRLDPGDILDKG